MRFLLATLHAMKRATGTCSSSSSLCHRHHHHPWGLQQHAAAARCLHAAPPPAAATPAAAPAAAPLPCAHSIPRQWLLTLEQPIAAPKQLDQQLSATNAFSADVHPDLPIATTWQGLVKALRQPKPAAAAAAAAADAPPPPQQQQQALGPDGARRLRVATIGVQLRSEEECVARLCAAVGVTPQGQRVKGPSSDPAADAVLVVSGSHPIRQLPLLNRLLPNSVGLLRAARRLRDQGVLPPDLQLWAVANPVVERSAALAAAKVEAGAQVLLTQPPLDWPAFESWMQDADARGVTRAARLVAGFPCLSGSQNVAFWGALCGASTNPRVQRLVASFAAAEAAEAAGKQPPGTPSAMALEWNLALLQQLAACAGVAGLHFMPLTAAGKRIALHVLNSS